MDNIRLIKMATDERLLDVYDQVRHFMEEKQTRKNVQLFEEIVRELTLRDICPVLRRGK